VSGPPVGEIDLQVPGAGSDDAEVDRFDHVQQSGIFTPQRVALCRHGGVGPGTHKHSGSFLT
jgi:hypothetical protein